MFVARLVCAALLLSVASYAESCPDTRPTHWFPSGRQYSAGLPETAVALPTGMTPCDLHELHTYCVEQINLYRTGVYTFRDGIRWGKTYPPVAMMNTEMLKCHNERALTDTQRDNAENRCDHFTFGYSCGFGGQFAENSCCKRRCNTLATCKSTLDGCLRQMYEEGTINRAANSESMLPGTGHYWIMMKWGRFATCGFGWDDQNRVYMTQNFYDRSAGCTYACEQGSMSCGLCWSRENQPPAPPTNKPTVNVWTKQPTQLPSQFPTRMPTAATVSNPTPASESTAYPTEQPTPSTPAGYQVQDQTSCGTGNLPVYNGERCKITSDPGSCLAVCDGSDDCAGFTYVPAGQKWSGDCSNGNVIGDGACFFRPYEGFGYSRFDPFRQCFTKPAVPGQVRARSTDDPDYTDDTQFGANAYGELTDPAQPEGDLNAATGAGASSTMLMAASAAITIAFAL